jgi:hypothetical protein
MHAAAAPLLLLLARAESFVLMGENLTTADGRPLHLPGKAHRWSLPAASSSDEGLGGGIAWVMDPNFCEQIIGHFPEESVFRGVYAAHGSNATPCSA